MIVKRPKNTKKEGIIEFFVYKAKDIFVGVCLTFDILEEGHNPAELMKSIKEAAELHLETVIKKNLPEKLLNRHAPKEYWEKYFAATKGIEKLSTQPNVFPVISPYHRLLMTQIA